MPKLVTTLLILLLAGGAAWWWFKLRPGTASAAPRYETTAADRGGIVARVTATGTLSALVTVQVGSQVSGRIAELTADFNSTVRKGQVLARIDAQLFQATADQAAANRTVAEGNLVKAQAESLDADRQYARIKGLMADHIVTQADLDTAETTAATAHAQVTVAQGTLAQTTAAFNQTQINIGYTTILSPVDGTVISRNVDAGQTVAASLQAPTLFTIAGDLTQMQVDTNVAEGDVGKLSAETPVNFTVDAYPGERFRGKVRQIRYNAQVLQNVVTYDAVIDVANPDLRLRPGMTANVTFTYAQREDALRVPNAALRYRAPPQLAAIAAAADKVATEKAAAEKAAADKAVADKAATGGKPTGDGKPATAKVADDGAPREHGRRRGPTDRRTVWLLRDGAPVPVAIRIGISDGTQTEVLEGELKDGDQLITDGGPLAPAAAVGGGVLGAPAAGQRRMF